METQTESRWFLLRPTLIPCIPPAARRIAEEKSSHAGGRFTRKPLERRRKNRLPSLPIISSFWRILVPESARRPASRYSASCCRASIRAWLWCGNGDLRPSRKEEINQRKNVIPPWGIFCHLTYLESAKQPRNRRQIPRILCIITAILGG